MSSSILNIGVQGLNANQTALSTVGQNIANVNTEGYSRQTVQFGTQDPPILGVEVKDIQRITDQFLVRQVWSDTSTFSSNEAYSEKIALLDNMMVSDSTSLSTAMDSYFTSLQQLVDDPLYIANRQLFLAEAQSLANSFNDFDSKLRQQTDLINTEIRSMTSSVNSITQNIADLNVQIGTLESSGQNSNELQDKRDLLVKELSSYLSVQVIEQDGGTYNVITGEGQPLIIGSSASRLELRNSESDPSQLDIYMISGQITANVTDQLGEGSLGGLARYRDDVLQPTINEVGRLAIVFSDTMNQQHRKGMDLNGDAGEDLFRSVKEGQVTANSGNKSITSTTNVTIYDTTQLTGSDYQLKITDVGEFEIRRLSDGKVFEMRDFEDLEDPSDAELTINDDETFRWEGNLLKVSVDGITMHIDGDDTSLAVGNSYLVQPTRSGAQLMETEITNPQMLALASPLRVEAATTNSGNAELVSIEIGSTKDTSPLRQGAEVDMELVFNADGTYSIYDTRPENENAPQLIPLIDAEGNTVDSLAYVSGEPIKFTAAATVAGQSAGELELFDFSITLENEPNAGDRFTIGRNIDGYSDNSNALALSDLQDKPLVNGFSYQDTYGQMLASVGTKASTAEIAYSSSKSVLQASESALQSVAGVNLDEEAANLVKFQQAYTAAAQMISAYQTIFDSLISAVRR
ncbi:MAG: flagellar hook-associated protein FlgK [Oceanospirillaceae bacterium]|nr:flagellar hook-associated protein FlgK [Oceanospirillaceae bacterium]